MVQASLLICWVAMSVQNLLSPLQECWDSGCAPPCLVYGVLGIKLKVLCLLGKHSTELSTQPCKEEILAVLELYMSEVWGDGWL